MTLPRVSVIVPVYKTEKYIDQCVQTILQQNYQNIEIILVDDGSPDGCGKICDKYTEQDPRIRVIHKANGGLSDARNAGIALASGEYITFIDSDDFIMPDMVEQLMCIIVSNKVDIAQCGYVRCDCNSVLVRGREKRERIEQRVYTADRMEAYLRDHVIQTTACGKIYKAELFDEIRFPVGRLHEDVFTTYKLIHEAGSMAVTDYVGYVYRITEDSITTSRFTPKKLDSIYGEIERAEFIEKNYPNLSNQAYSGIIYACNQCLLQMSKSGFSGKKEDAFLQKLYRQYGGYYICDNVSFLGKIVVALAMVSEHWAKSALALKR